MPAPNSGLLDPGYGFLVEAPRWLAISSSVLSNKDFFIDDFRSATRRLLADSREANTDLT